MAAVVEAGPGVAEVLDAPIDGLDFASEFIAASSDWLLFCAIAGEEPPALDRPALPSLENSTSDLEAELLRGARLYLRLLRARMAPALRTVEHWERFYTLYNPLLRRMVLRCGVQRSEAEDLLQEVWVELSRKLADFAYDPARGRFRSWLRVVVQRKVLAHRRRRILGRLRADARALAEHPCHRLPEPPVRSDQQTLQAGVLIALAEFRRCVPETTYQVLHLMDLDGCSVAEVAERLGLKPAQVWARHCRARQKFRRLPEARELLGSGIS